LKRAGRPSWGLDSQVAPFTGAWIETLQGDCTRLRGNVAPFTGAWIETLIKAGGIKHDRWSPPSRGRGLKLASFCR